MDGIDPSPSWSKSLNKQSFIRARSPEHKARRADDILAAARLVLDRDGIDAVTLASIAREAGVVKSNIYRYYESREEILFRLLLKESEHLTSENVKLLNGLPRPVSIPEMARLMAKDFANRPRFCLLVSQLAPILERNISVEKLIDMKRETAALLLQISEAILRAIPEIGEVGAMKALHTSIYLIAGLWPMTNPPEQVVKALETPDLAFMRVDFETSLRDAIEALFEGAKSANKQMPKAEA